SVGSLPDAAKLTNISVWVYRGVGLIMCGTLGSLSGIYLAASQGQVGVAEWDHGLGYLALGVAFASRGAVVRGILVAGGLALFRSVSFIPEVPRWVPMPETLLPMLPYVFVIL